MLTSSQVRAARGLLRWSARHLAEQSGVHIATVQRIERSNGAISGTAKSVFKIKAALEAEGVEFLSQEGYEGVRIGSQSE